MQTKTATPRPSNALAVALCLIATPAMAQGHIHQQSGPPAATQEGGRIDFLSGRFHVLIDGPEYPIGDVILIPGLSSSPAVWDGLTEQLKGSYRIHRVHIHGFAGAPAADNATGSVAGPVAEDIARYISELRLTKPAVIGHSMGGTIGLMLAARHPDSISKLMVVDMIPFMGSLFGGPSATPATLAPMADQFYTGMANSPREQWLAQSAASVTGMINTANLRAGPIEDGATSDQRVAAASFRELIVTDLRPELPRITAPTRVLYVEVNSPGMTPEMIDATYEAAYSGLSGVVLKRIEDSAHFIMLDQLDRFAAEVIDFLQ